MRLRPIPRSTRERLRRQGARLLPPVVSSSAVEEEYENVLREKLVDPMVERTQSLIIPAALSALAGKTGASALTQTLEGVASLFAGVKGWAHGVARSILGREREHGARKFREGLIHPSIGGFLLSSIVAEEKIDQLMALRVAENVSLISSIPEQYFQKLNVIVYETVTGGQSGESMIERIQKLYGVTERRARIIARDQVSKANGNMTMIRQMALGIEEYVWQTAQDERVRPTHRSKHGKTFRWDEPPEDTGHPGHDYLCRCIAIGVLRD